MCYNITLVSPPYNEYRLLPQPRLELGYRIHGNAFQVHRVCHCTTGAECRSHGTARF